MASFGEDVPMGDFRMINPDGTPEDGAGHTSDGSVLNVQIPTGGNPRSDAARAAGTAAAGPAFGDEAGPARSGQVPCSSSRGAFCMNPARPGRAGGR